MGSKIERFDQFSEGKYKVSARLAGLKMNGPRRDREPPHTKQRHGTTAMFHAKPTVTRPHTPSLPVITANHIFSTYL
jgi:hypothetical protein